MEVIGEIPDDLQGHFLRVGPNPVYVFSEAAYHTFDGDGMIHAIEFSKAPDIAIAYPKRGLRVGTGA